MTIPRQSAVRQAAQRLAYHLALAHWPADETLAVMADCFADTGLLTHAESDAIACSAFAPEQGRDK